MDRPPNDPILMEPGWAEARAEGTLQGLRMTADEFFDRPDDGYRYELVEGVVVMSPSPRMRHQVVTMEIIRQINVFLTRHPSGQLLAETDMHLGRAKGRDFVYRPEVLFMTAEHLARAGDRLVGPPALAVEVVSQGSRRYDRITKKADYERFGVHAQAATSRSNPKASAWRVRQSPGSFLI
ncbi:MAG: Uma2 family endonuclease [Deltaproteobacteria bacterium]|nr:MAG: Uma2 family endonuclease [Deltaproteobacteria bacterium]